jgi:hypothetical protein
MGFYEDSASVANKLLKEKGQAITITRNTAGDYDPSTGTAAITTTTQNGWGAVFEYGTQQAGIYNAAGSLIKMGDKRLLLSPTNSTGSEITEPAMGDMVTLSDGTVFTVAQVKKLNPAGTVVLYDINLRKD